MRRVTVSIAAVGIAAALWIGSSPRVANACSLVRPTDDLFGRWVERSQIVAIGRWEGSDARKVILVIEQPLKGAAAGDRLPVDNRTTYTAFSCSPYDEPFREGHRFVPGERAVVLLEKEVDGLWQVGYSALAVFEVPDSVEAPLEGLGWAFGQTEAGTPTDIKLSTIIKAAGYTGPVSLGPWATPPPGAGRLPTVAPTRRPVVSSGFEPASDDHTRWPFIAAGFATTAMAATLFTLARFRR